MKEKKGSVIDRLPSADCLGKHPDRTFNTPLRLVRDPFFSTRRSGILVSSPWPSHFSTTGTMSTPVLAAIVDQVKCNVLTDSHVLDNASKAEEISRTFICLFFLLLSRPVLTAALCSGHGHR